MALAETSLFVLSSDVSPASSLDRLVSRLDHAFPLHLIEDCVRKHGLTPECADAAIDLVCGENLLCLVCERLEEHGNDSVTKLLILWQAEVST